MVKVAPRFSEFAEAVKTISGLDVNLCFQCAKCASGCPVSYAMDYTPTQLIHAIQLGLTDLVMNSKTMWLCASCQTCSTRCPQDVDLAGVMDAVRIIAQRKKIKAKIPEVPIFYRSSLRNIALFGRMYELGLIATLKLLTRSFTKDMGLGLRMLRKGKLNIFPSFKGALAARRIFSQVKAREKR
ncbi:MAG TPA: heterodisulfide reductase subunit C [Dehalococcoidia bacterium]|nr:heterodisulfide reductase subunit C [Dehalococcoidia bacterium]